VSARSLPRRLSAGAAATGPLAQAVWLLPKEPGSLDLSNDNANDQSDVVMTNVCEKLNRLNPDMTVGPGLATKYEWTTPTTLTFTLRDDVTFHDGARMTVDDVLWSMKRNATEGNSEADEFVNVKSFAQSGPNQITFTMTQPDAVFVEAPAGGAGLVQERKVVEARPRPDLEDPRPADPQPARRGPPRLRREPDLRQSRPRRGRPGRPAGRGDVPGRGGRAGQHRGSAAASAAPVHGDAAVLGARSRMATRAGRRTARHLSTPPTDRGDP
jgi:hypothetical protein